MAQWAQPFGQIKTKIVQMFHSDALQLSWSNYGPQYDAYAYALGENKRDDDTKREENYAHQ
jgi:hypothetical protein